MKYFQSIIFIMLSFVCSSLFASDLVDINWLKANSQKVKVIDLRSEDQYKTGHIPHAINIPYSQLSRKKNNVDGFVETPKVFKSVMEENGVSNNDVVVLYSDWSFLDSMRIYWVMDFYGHKQIKVLNGGIQSWIEEGDTLSFNPETVSHSQYVIEVNSEILTTKFRTFMASKNSNYILVDGREKKQFMGEKSLTDRKGHIPNAINIPWFDLINNRTEDHEYDRISHPSTLQDLQTLMQKLSVIPDDKNIILYCNGGQESSVLYFALKELGVKASVYDGSWFEWSNDANMPVVSGTGL